MHQVNYSEVKDLKELKTELQPWLASTEYNFGWLKSIVELSLDEYLLAFLKEYVPKYDRYVTLDIRDHISEVNSLINKCTELRKRIFDAESMAITTAISYSETIKNMGPNEMLSSLSLKATYHLSKEENITDFESAQAKKNLTLKNILYAKFNLHNQSGNALNYGEIVTSLRKLYADNIKTIYERLFIVKRTLKYSFGQETAALPNFFEVRNSLDDFIWWIRHELDHFDYKAQFDFEHTIVLSLNPAEVEELKRTGICKFEVSDMLLNSPSINLAEYLPRVSQLSVTVSNVDHYIYSERYIADNLAVYADIRTNDSHRNQAAQIDGRLMNNNENRAGDYAIKANVETIANCSFYTVDITPPVVIVPLAVDGLFNPTKAEQEQFESDLKTLGAKVFLPKIVDFKKGNAGAAEAVMEAADENYITVPGKISYGPISVGRRAGELSETNKFRGGQVMNIQPNGIWTLGFRNVSSATQAREIGLNQIGNVELSLKLTFRKKD